MASYPPSAEAEIAAPIERVFDALLDGSRYPEWNPLILSEEGDSFAVGAPVTMRVRLGPVVVRPTRATVRVTPPGETDGRRAEWVHRFASGLAKVGLVQSQRHHELEAHGGGTRYVTYEHFRGPLSWLLPYGAIDAGFKAQAAALRRTARGVPLAPATASDGLLSALTQNESCAHETSMSDPRTTEESWIFVSLGLLRLPSVASRSVPRPRPVRCH